MATGVVIRLTNLPLAAGAIDIRHFFKGLTIPNGGVHIIGGDDGTAFILFSTDEDARQAMLQGGLQLCGAKIKLMLSSHSEMKSVIEQSQRMCEQLRGQRLLEPPITSLSKQSNVRSFQPKKQSPKKQLAPESLDANDVYIEIKGMPFSVNQTDIVYFFSPLNVSAIKFMLDEKGRKNGSGFVKFSCAMEKLHGLKRDRKFIGSRFVKLSSVSERQWLLANSLPSETVRLESEISINRKRQQSHSSEETIPKRSRELSPLKTDNCVEVSGLPSSVTFKGVGDFFTRLRFVDGGLYVEMDGGLCKGIAYVEFKSYSDYQLALKKDGDILNGKQIRVISLSKQIMLDKISRHKKYVKAKREELEKHKLSDKSFKQTDHPKKKENRKQKEMDEWLRRQHEKEQNERKKSEIEKQNLDENKILAQLLSDAKALDSLKQTGDFDLKKEIIRKLEELAGKSSCNKEEPVIAEEPLLGAGEMELDDDNSNEPNMPTSSHIQQNIAISSSNNSSNFSLSASGNSGSVVTPQVPLSYNPPISFLNPFFPNMPPLPSNVSSLSTSHLLPVLAKPPFLASQATTVNAPPLPPIAVPPPIPPVVGSLPPTFQTTISSLPNASAVVSGFTVPEIRPLERVNEAVVDSEYVRVANSPFNVTEEDVRQFFFGLQIPRKGIQFINKVNGNRSGHIFIKFDSKRDAAKAVLKDDQNFCGRSVLVKTSSMKTFSAIYEKLTKGGKYIPTFDDIILPKSNDDNIFTKRILDDKMTCVCIGNVPSNATKEDIVKILGNIKFNKSKIVILHDANGNCKGDVYVEIESPSECVKAADLHGVAKIGDQIVRVLPLTLEAMVKDLQSRQRKPNLVKCISKSNGHSTDQDTFSSNQISLVNHQIPTSVSHRSEHVDHNVQLPTPSFELLKNSFFDAALQPQSFPSADFILPSTTDDFLRLPNPLSFPPPVPNIPPPPLASNVFLNPPPLPLPTSRVTALKMSNLSYKITREDIVEFFGAYDLISDSIRLMYNNNGKPTGDGILAFSSFEGASAALENLNGKQFLGRKLKLMLQ